MKRHLVLVAVGLAALAGASLAVAKAVPGNQTATAVSGTFDAKTISGKVDTRTCTTTDGKTITASHAVYQGSASGSPDLSGAIKIDARSVVNSTDDVGVVNGRLTIQAAAGKTNLGFSGVYDHGSLAGLAAGKGATHGTRVIANLSAGFSAAGFTGGRIGGGTAGGSAVEIGPSRCAPNRPVHQNSQANGTVGAVSPTSITVAGLTCAVPSELSATVLKFQVGDRAHIRCTLVNNVTTLVKIDPKKEK